MSSAEKIKADLLQNGRQPIVDESVLIYEAIKKGDVCFIESSLRKKNIFSDCEVHNCWLLYEAINSKNVEIVSTFLQYGVCVEPCSNVNNINSALHEAVTKGYKPVIVELLHYNADWKKINNHGQSVLHLAFDNNYLHNSMVSVDRRSEVKAESEKIIIQIIELFLDLGIDINVKNRKKHTPLFLAASHRMMNVAKYLMDRGANISSDKLFIHSLIFDEADSFHREQAASLWNPELMRCIARDNVEFLEWILSKNFDCNLQNRQGKTALQLAVEYNLVHLLPSLLEHATDATLQHQDCRTMLHTFLKANPKRSTVIDEKINHLELSNRFQDIESIAKMMISKGASVDDADEIGTSPCLLAARQGRKELLRFMLDRSSNTRVARSIWSIVINSWVDRDGQHFDGSDEIISILISRRLFVHREDKCSKKLILYAIKHPFPRTLEALHASGADFTACTDQGENLLHLAIKEYNWRRNNAKLEDVVRVIVKTGCDVNGKKMEGKTPLHDAASSGAVGIARILLENGAEVDARDGVFQHTPLHMAAKYGHASMVEVLIENGADVNARQRAGKTSLHLTISHRRDDVVKTLLRLGADVDAEDCQGSVPLHAALQLRNKEVLEYLLEYGVDTTNMNDRLLPVCNSFARYDVGWHTFFQHFNKLQDARLPYARLYQPYLDSYVLALFKFVEFKETDKLKEFTIEGSVTMYNFLHMNPVDRFVYTKHEKFNDLTSWVVHEFPEFHRIILASYREAIARKSLRDPAKCAWLELTGIYLPDICIERIFYYLSNKTLKVMINGIESSNTLKRSEESTPDIPAKKNNLRLSKTVWIIYNK